jgi:hypothetical protein
VKHDHPFEILLIIERISYFKYLELFETISHGYWEETLQLVAFFDFISTQIGEA